MIPRKARKLSHAHDELQHLKTFPRIFSYEYSVYIRSVIITIFLKCLFISQITGATPYFAAVFVGGLFIVVGVVSGDASGQYINRFS